MRPDPGPLPLVALLAGLWLAPPAAAQGDGEPAAQSRAADEEPPLVVESNELVIRDADKEAVYTGDVVATKGDMTLRADRLVVRYTEAGIDRAHAFGEPATMEQGERNGHAAEVIYQATDRSLVLVGDAYLEEGPNTLEGARIRYYLDTQRAEVFSGEEGRARGVFHPDNPPAADGDGSGRDGP